MSVKVMGLVWDEPIKKDMKFVLLAYADHADHSGGNIYPAIETIAKKTGYDPRSVQRITTALQKAGYLTLDAGATRKGGVGKPTHWRIPVKDDKLSPIPKGDKTCKVRVTKRALKGDTVSPDPSLNATIRENQTSETPLDLTWKKWEAYRKEIRKPLKETTRKMQWAFLLKNENDAVAIMEQSMLNGWTGLFELKQNGHAPKPTPPAPARPSEAELKALRADVAAKVAEREAKRKAGFREVDEVDF